MTGVGAGLDDVFADVASASDDKDFAFGGHWRKISGEESIGKTRGRAKSRLGKKVEEKRKGRE